MDKRVEFNDAKSNKFWQVKVEGTEVLIEYGKIGTEGRENKKSFENSTEALEFAEKKLKEKLKKGYIEVKLEQDLHDDHKSDKSKDFPESIHFAVEQLNNKEWDALNDSLDDITDDIQSQSIDTLKEKMILLEECIKVWPELELIEGTRFGWNLIYLSKVIYDKGIVIPFLTEQAAYNLGMHMNYNGDDGDAFTQGLAYALYLFPDSKMILDAILDDMVNRDYMCEGAVEDAVKTASGERKILLKTIDLLCTFHMTLGYGTEKDAMKYLIRDTEWAKKKIPEFNIEHFKIAIEYIKTTSNISFWKLPNDGQLEDIEVLLEML
jgi:predicted DNA-binding WGR domain protein